ncbi:MAG: L-Ala-D/L-Glu epimerase [Rhizobacter sp.]|nr:L-Ala-D/L-Glu epimerase [Rhizobacter sp.]
MPTLSRIDAWLLLLPLERPYKLSFGPVAALNTVFVRITRTDGQTGWGEATLLHGYTDETIAGTWAKVRELLAAPPSADAADVAHAADTLERWLAPLDADHPFLTTAFRTAAEMAARHPLLNVASADGKPVRVPILGLLQGETPQRVAEEADALIAAGYTTLKVKVGFEPADDALMVAVAQQAVGGRALIRLDANQGYDAVAACDFIQRIDPSSIELFEQPCAAGDWDAHMAAARVAQERGLALMLDESIYSLREIEKAAELRAARYIKVKLMKFSGLDRLDAALARIRALGMTPVLGNGVANELSCWMEACIATRHIDNAGEMNGFLKPRERLFTHPLRFVRGAIELQPGELGQMDISQVERLALDHVAWWAGSKVASAAGPVATAS